MANIPIRDIPGAVVASPDPSNLIPMDNGSLMQKTTIENAVNTTLPLSSQAEAEAGVDNAKRMSPLRTKQAIDAQTPAIVNVAITALNLGTMSQEAASDYTKTSGLAAVALSNSYTDLSSLPTLGTAAATDASDYATAAQGALADTAVQPGNAALVPSGGTIGQVLVKDSDTDYDTGWVSSASATAVSYAPQTLTESQQEQARENVDAMLNDPWAAQPIGVPIPLSDNLVGVTEPPTDKDYRYVKLTASDAYNTGILTGESVSGSAPLVIATAVIDLVNSPMDGETINLINTERRVLRAGAAGTVENDQMQGHWHDITRPSDGGRPRNVANNSSSGDPAVINSTLPLDNNSYRATEMLGDGVNGTPRIGNETRSKNIGVTYYMRIK